MSNENTQQLCPHCGSGNVAEILWGEPAWSKELERDLEEGRIVLGGCCVTDMTPELHCNACGCEFGSDPHLYLFWRTVHEHQRKSVVYGAAVGDALGVPYEFKARGSFRCEGMSEGGAHGVPKGTFSDDTSMLLATLDSLDECACVDIEDMRTRFRRWLNEGAYTADGRVFDVGNTTATALAEGKGCTHERSNGNGSLMRIAPLAFIPASDEQIEEVSAITHAHDISKKACVYFVHMLKGAFDDGHFGLAEAIEEHMPEDERFHFLADIVAWPREKVKSSGYVLDTLGAALWCVWNTKSYRECVLEAVNLGDDTDTTACVAGALAGAIYGYQNIPKEWIDDLRGKEIISDCLNDPFEDMPGIDIEIDWMPGWTEEQAQEAHEEYMRAISEDDDRQELTSDVRNALTRWKCGIMNINRALRGEDLYPEKTKIALKSSWEIEHMPRRKHATIKTNIELTEAELMELAKGHIPEEMEDHWFMYFDGEYIRYYRSWTGFCIYKGKVIREEGVPRIVELIVNRDPEQYSETDDEKDVLLFKMLITEDLGEDSEELWGQIFARDEIDEQR